MPTVDDSLPDYTDSQDPWTGILIGNGASRAVSSKFAYTSLYDVAVSGHIEHALTLKQQALFESMQTRNFEQVLSALATATFINRHLGIDTQPVQDAYEQIRIALVESVQSVHIPRRDVPESTLESIRGAIGQYDYVYSTNYDLLLYWALMLDGRAQGFADYYFSGMRFDPNNTEVWNNPTRVHYLHGALHLYVNQTRDTFKRLSGDAGNLLTAFGEPIENDESAVPLFVSEGASQDKMRSILNSTYLSHVFSVFSRHSNGLVIFGQALEPHYDAHLINAIRRSSNRRLRIGIYPTQAQSTIQAKSGWYQKFPTGFDLSFFDSRTHPLGSVTLAVC